MKIPANPSGPKPSPEADIHRGAKTRRGTEPADRAFDSCLDSKTGERSSGPVGTSRLAIDPSWHRSQLENPGTRNRMIQESVRMLVTSSPLAPQFSADQLNQLAHSLSGDPVLRELVTQHLEQSLV